MVKIAALKPYLYVDNVIEALIYRFEDLKWSKETVRSGLSIETIYTEAHNTLMKTIQEIGLDEGYLFVEVEGIGLKAFRIEGEAKGVLKILYPFPQPLNRIVIYKMTGGEYAKIHEATFSSEYWVYDGYINVKDMEWDLVVIESSLYRRAISRREYEELKPAIKIVKKRRRGRRKRRAKAGKRKRRSGGRT